MSFQFIFQDFDEVLLEVLTALTPILVMFLIFLLVYKLPREMLLTLLKGVLLAFTGLALFLQGVKAGFMPVGTEMGTILGELPYRWVLIPLGFILGFLATMAEPAVRILSNQVEENSSGYIKSNLILYTLCLAVGIFIALGMTRIVYGIPFYYIIIPGYLLAIILMLFSKPSFTAIAFDSGGVATGPMTVTFIMALAVGAADTIEGRDAVIDGFGLIALVALAPIIMVMLLGFIYPGEEPDNEIEGLEEEPGTGNRNHYDGLPYVQARSEEAEEDLQEKGTIKETTSGRGEEHENESHRENNHENGLDQPDSHLIDNDNDEEGENDGRDTKT